MEDTVYVAISNIPNDHRSSDLRAHFSSLIEGSSFVCFHYRHRPQKSNKISNTESEQVKHVHRCCCVVKIVKHKYDELMKLNNSQWTNSKGEILQELCHMKSITINTSNHDDNEDSVKEDVLLAMPELNPPSLMPYGNVGTPTLVFLDLIQRCLLPQSLVSKLQLKFPKTSAKRIYGNVNFLYDSKKFGKRDSFLDSVAENMCTRLDKDKFLTPKMYPIHFAKKLYKDKRSFQSSNTQQLSHTSMSDKEGDETSLSINAPDSALNNHPDAEHILPTERLSAVSLTPMVEDPTSLQPTDQLSTPDKVHQQNTLTDKEKKKLLRKENKIMRTLMSEGIEEKLIAIERKYYDEDAAEEWDRHEASEDDPSNQERNKERLYDEEIEQPWEKGGAGVNFYTDAVYWQAQEGDFDEQTTDDLDVDFSAYEEPGSGDKDIRDFLKIRQETRFRNGYDKTDRFSIGIGKRLPVPSHQPKASTPRNDHLSEKPIGAFEKYSKGIGRRIMEKHGWTDGTGLGSSQHGIVSALKGEGQSGHNKRGLGYIPERQQIYGLSRTKKSREAQHITTVYDDLQKTDPKEDLLQRAELSTLKHRQSHLNKLVE
ncbi:G patch domain-containing protein 3 [Bulinus truncatus]|nr:G patch domain-containing protein 3 [Bulinus truncatus]